jgi:mRNA interferase HigB
MRVISFSKLREFYATYPDAESNLRAWYKATENASWHDLVEIRKTFNSTDLVSKAFIFNICGNKYRLIAYIDFNRQKVYIRYVLTHKEYDQNKWKKDEWFQ